MAVTLEEVPQTAPGPGKSSRLKRFVIWLAWKQPRISVEQLRAGSRSAKTSKQCCAPSSPLRRSALAISLARSAGPAETACLFPTPGHRTSLCLVLDSAGTLGRDQGNCRGWSARVLHCKTSHRKALQRLSLEPLHLRAHGIERVQSSRDDATGWCFHPPVNRALAVGFPISRLPCLKETKMQSLQKHWFVRFH